MRGKGLHLLWILLIAVIINIAGVMATGMKRKNVTKCPYDLTVASSMIPSSCYANNTYLAIEDNTCCWSVFASYVFAISLYANRTGTVLLDANGSRHCTNEFVRFVRSRGLVHPGFFSNNSSNCAIDPSTFTANAGPCRYATLGDISKVIDVGNPSIACDGPNLKEAKACEKCQNKVIENAMDLLNLTNSKEFVPCGMVITMGIWGRNPSEERFRGYVGCVLQVLGNIGGLGTSSLIPSPPPTLIPSPPPVPDTHEQSGGNKKGRNRVRIGVGGGIIGSGVVILVLAVLMVVKFKKRNGPSEDSTASSSLQGVTESKRTETVAREPLPTEGLYIFTKCELQTATEDFSEARVLGIGGSGKVYLGQLPSGKQVAIKRIVQKTKVDQFYQEVELLSRLRHRNLTSLLGYCQHRREHILVYEYMPGGDLGCLLYSREDPVLLWDRRLRIALDCAEGLAHLHLFPEGAIIHRDIKPTNILLNESGQAKLSDFGISKLIAPDFSHASTEIKGTTGYLDPEYFTVGKLTDASDVYSFGIVLLELISGQRAVITTPSGGAESLVYTTHVFMNGEDPDVRNLVDPRIADAVDACDLESIKMVLGIAYSSVQPYSNDRPSMLDVLNVIKEAWKKCSQKPDEVSRSILHIGGE